MSSKIPLFNSNDKVIGIAGAMHTLEHSDTPSVYRQFAEAINFVLKHYEQNLRVAELAEMSDCAIALRLKRRFVVICECAINNYSITGYPELRRTSLFRPTAGKHPAIV